VAMPGQLTSPAPFAPAGNKVLQAAGILVLSEYAASGQYLLDGAGVNDMMQTTCALGAIQREAVATGPLSPADKCVHDKQQQHLHRLIEGPSESARQCSNVTLICALCRATATQTVSTAVGSVPLTSPLFAALRAVSNAIGPVVPTESSPIVPAADPMRAVAARVQVCATLADMSACK
jgi:hypothetical protein